MLNALHAGDSCTGTLAASLGGDGATQSQAGAHAAGSGLLKPGLLGGQLHTPMSSELSSVCVSLCAAPLNVNDTRAHPCIPKPPPLASELQKHGPGMLIL